MEIKSFDQLIAFVTVHRILVLVTSEFCNVLRSSTYVECVIILGFLRPVRRSFSGHSLLFCG